MDVKFSETEITPHQADLARRIEDVVARAAVYRRTEVASTGNGPSVEFEVYTTDPGLSVRFVIYQDSVHLLANGAEACMEMVEPKHYGAWSDAAVSAIAAVFEGPLRIRVRRTLFKRRQTGAVYLQHGGRAGWTGELLACLGIGKTFGFDDWFRRNDG